MWRRQTIWINLDVSSLISVAGGLKSAMEKAVKEQVALLVAQTRGHITEEVNKRLHTRRAMYIENLSHFQDGDVWVISLAAKAVWIEEGMPEHSMLDDLLKSKNVKRAKDGSAYTVVPFELNKGPTQLTPAQQTLTDTLKSVMKQKGIPYGKLEMDAGGSAKTGLLHKFDIMDAPMKTQGPWGGSSLGHGAVGEVQQGPTGIPFLQGVNVYQRQVTDAAGQKHVKKSIVTFRVASSKHRGQGRWEHPGLEPCNFFEEAREWANEQWDKEICPAILDSILSQV